MRRSPLLALLAGALAGLLVPAPAQAALDWRDDCDRPFPCATLSVPLDRSGAVPGTVRLRVERPHGDGRGSSALIALAGGPGQSATSLTERFNRDFFGVAGSRDVIVFDQRGTGRSEALNCRELERARAGATPEIVARCAERLGPRRAFYTTEDSVADIEALRRELGVERLVLYGVSYGTRVATAYALRHPGRVERLVLDSVVPPEGQEVFELGSFAALPRVLRALCQDACAGITRDLPADLARVAARMRERPLRGPFVDRRGRRRTLALDQHGLFELLRLGDGSPEHRAELPAALAAAARGDAAQLLRLEHRFAHVAPPPPQPRLDSLTLHVATVCEEAALPWERTAPPAERLPQARARLAAVPPARFAPFAPETALRTNNVRDCLGWPATPAPRAPGPGPLPDVPVLLLAGEEDIRTPVEDARAVAARFPRAQLVVAPRTGHDVMASAPCARRALAAFFAGRAAAGACRRVARTIPLVPRAPRSLAEVAARGAPGAAGRTAAAVALTIEDLRREVTARAFVLGGVNGGGLRAGRFAQRGRTGDVVARGLSFVPGVTVTGAVSPDARQRGRLTVGGGAAARGTLTLRRGLLEGRLGGRPVRLRLG